MNTMDMMPLSFSHWILACSGEHADEAIVHNERLALGCVAVGAVLVGCMIYLHARRQKVAWPAYIGCFLIFLNPAWLFSARTGDCGMLMMIGAAVVLLIHAGLLIAQLCIEPKNPKRRPSRL